MAATLGLICRQLLKESAAVTVCTKHAQTWTLTVRSLSSSSARYINSSSSSSNDNSQSRRPHYSSSAVSPPTTSIITRRNLDGFELSSPGAPGNPHPRPLVLLIGYLNAQRKHLQKYQEVYWERGFDVLTMSVRPIHVIWPQMGIKYINRVLKVLQENKDINNRQVVVHGFSVGAFIYTQMHLLLLKQQEQKQNFHPSLSSVLKDSYNTGNDLGARIAGLVLDSPAYTDSMCEGIANSVTDNPLGRSLITNTLLFYLGLFPKSVTSHYKASMQVFHGNIIPTLMIYSAADVISCHRTSEMYVEEWKQKGFPTFTNRFEDSSHVLHFKQYPEQYREGLHLFLDQLDLQGDKIIELEESTEAAAAAEVQ